MAVARGWGGRRKGEMVVKSYKFPAIKQINLGDLIHSMVTIINNTVLSLKVVKRVDLKSCCCC